MILLSFGQTVSSLYCHSLVGMDELLLLFSNQPFPIGLPTSQLFVSFDCDRYLGSSLMLMFALCWNTSIVVLKSKTPRHKAGVCILVAGPVLEMTKDLPSFISKTKQAETFLKSSLVSPGPFQTSSFFYLHYSSSSLYLMYLNMYVNISNIPMGTLEKEMKSSTSSFVECISEKSQLSLGIFSKFFHNKPNTNKD